MESRISRLLVVDDNAMNRDMLSRRLERHGYEVAMADDGRQALGLIGETAFDLVLLDVMMPGISGMEVLETLRETHPATELPVIMVTARDQSEDIVAALKLGANDYVTKPLDFPVVLARCQTQLSLRDATLKVASLNRELDARNKFVRETFGRYVSDDVVRNLLDSPHGLKLGGEKRDVTLLMADLRGFAALCEQVDPEKVVRLLNVYLGSMTDVIVRYEGTIDEFIGDGIFVIFGAPKSMDDHPCRAVACALAMQLGIDAVNEQLVAEGLPEVQMGIGIHTGEVVVGNVGSERRAKFGAVGRNVNVTGRIETYSVGGQVLVSEATYDRLRNDAICSNSFVMDGKGLSSPIRLYQVQEMRSAGLALSDRSAKLYVPSEPLPVEITALDGKHLTSEMKDGLIVRVSRTGAEISSGLRPALWSNLKIQFAGLKDEEAVYAKVVKKPKQNESLFHIRFTSFSSGLGQILEQIDPGD